MRGDYYDESSHGKTRFFIRGIIAQFDARDRGFSMRRPMRKPLTTRSPRRSRRAMFRRSSLYTRTTRSSYGPGKGSSPPARSQSKKSSRKTAAAPPSRRSRRSAARRGKSTRTTSFISVSSTTPEPVRTASRAPYGFEPASCSTSPAANGGTQSIMRRWDLHLCRPRIAANPRSRWIAQ